MLQSQSKVPLATFIFLARSPLGPGPQGPPMIESGRAKLLLVAQGNEKGHRDEGVFFIIFLPQALEVQSASSSCSSQPPTSPSTPNPHPTLVPNTRVSTP